MNSRYLIVEDEYISCERLRDMLGRLRPSFRFAGWVETVEDAVEFLRSESVDLIFMDIELADRNCFEIFSRVRVTTPVIFTTAYNEYAIKAFRVNSVDYILKPLEEQDLKNALDKFEQLKITQDQSFDYGRLREIIDGYASRDRILINKGDTLLFIEIKDIAYFFSEEKYTLLHTFSGEEHITDYTLSQLEELLSKRDFFRVSRGHILNLKAVREIRRHFNGRLKIYLKTLRQPEILVTAARREKFLAWLRGSSG